MTSGIGTPLYKAPELIKREDYNEKVDIWAFGCVLYEMLTLTALFHGKKNIFYFFYVGKNEQDVGKKIKEITNDQIK